MFHCVICKKDFKNEQFWYRLGEIHGNYCVCRWCAAKQNYAGMYKEGYSLPNQPVESELAHPETPRGQSEN